MHQGVTIIVTLLAYFLFSAAVGAMLPPTHEQETRFYGWLYRFLQRLAANADRLASARFGPGLVAAHLSDLAETPADPLGGGERGVATLRRVEASSVTYTEQP